MSVKQRTLKSEFSLSGKGLHTGKTVSLLLSLGLLLIMWWRLYALLKRTFTH